jgi:hypothetical protein
MKNNFEDYMRFSRMKLRVKKSNNSADVS